MTAPTVTALSYVGLGAETGNSPSVSFTLSADTNRVLEVVCGYEIINSGTTQYTGVNLISGITVVAAMHKAAGDIVTTGSAGTGIELYYLLDAELPAPGVYSIVPTSNGSATRWVNSVKVIRNAKQQAPVPGTFAKTTTAAPSLASSVTPPTNNALILCAFATDSPGAQTAAETLVGSTISGAGGLRLGQESFAQTTAGAKSMSFAMTSGNFLRAISLSWYYEEIPVGANDIACITPVDGFCAQRRPTSANVVLGGTYTGADPDTIKVKLTLKGVGTVVMNFTTLTSTTIGSGVWTGTLANVPQGGDYIATPQSWDASPAILATGAPGLQSFGVGKVFPLCGSSSAAKWAINPSSVACHALGRYFDGTNWTRPTAGGGAINFINDQIAKDPGIPVAILPNGVSGSGLANWVTGSSFFAYANAVAAAGVIGAIEAYLDIGTSSNDARDGIDTGQAWFDTRWVTYKGNIRTDFVSGVYATLPIVHSGCQRTEGSGETGVDIDWTRARYSELKYFQDAATFPSDVYVTPVDLGLNATDHIHPTDANFEVLGRRASRAFAARILGISVNWRGPYPTAAAYNTGSGVCDVTFATPYGTGIVNSKNDGSFDFDPSCFVLRDSGGTAQTITSATAVSPTVARLVAPSGLGAGVTVDYMPGRNPGSGVAPAGVNCVFDNATAA